MTSRRIGELRDETKGIRGMRFVSWAKNAFARTVVRAMWYGQFAASVEFAMALCRERGRPLCYYEFGTGAGSTLKRAIAAMRGFDVSLFLFDSFRGLPPPADGDGNWKGGDFAYSEEYILRVVKRAGFPVERVTTIPGFYEASLTDELASSLRSSPPAFVTVDVDYYSSALTVLNFLRPLLSSGTIVYFDDLTAFDGHPQFGQLRAIREFNDSWPEGQLVPHPLLGGLMYVCYLRRYEHRR